MSKGVFSAILTSLWRSGVLHLTPAELVKALQIWWSCGNSFALLAEIAAMRFPAYCAIHDEDGALSFAEMVGQSNALAASLNASYGLRAGLKCAMLCRNHRGFAIALLALSRLGVDVLLLNPDSPRTNLGAIVQQQAPDLLLCDEEFEKTWADDFSVGVYVLDQSEFAQSDFRPKCGLPRLTRPSQLVVLTSGSTGRQKGIRRRPSLWSVLPVFSALIEGLPISLHRPALLAIPLFHGYGLATFAMTLALAAPLHMARRFEIAPITAQLPDNSAPIVVSVPTLLKRWLDKTNDLANFPVGAIITGSAPLNPELCTDLLNTFGDVIFNLYGSTEAGVMCMANPHQLRLAPGTVGHPLTGTMIKVLSPNGSPVDVGEVGQIFVRGPLVLYLDQSGWYDTGDLGYLDSESRLFVVGRKDNMFISGGENVYPETTEKALLTHPSVKDAAVLVQPDSEFGQSMVALVVPKTETIQEEELRSWLRERLERYQLPRQVRIVSSIPRNSLGKVDQAAL
ncbi:MAG: AMP-binding protein [Candidatus Obscuribacterales bacterium]|nr:AMP-binding protein [Candidatus Obscuribacterales bacterium]